MVRNYLKVAIRSLIKYKVYTLVNVTGLAVGLAAVFLITLFLKHELSYDRFVNNSEKIYRVITEFNGEKIPTSVNSAAEFSKETFPEVQQATSVFKRSRGYMKYQEEKYGRYRPVYTDAGFLNVFPFTILSRLEQSLLEAPNTAVITSGIASKVFGDIDPLNKTFIFDEKEFRIVGVIESIPDNFHLPGDILLSISTLDKRNYLERVGNGFGTYFLLNKPMNEITREKFSREMEQYVKRRYQNEGYTFNISFQPLRRIHLYSDFSYDYSETGNRMNILVFSLVGVFILIVAIFNFLNLSLVKSRTRTKEIAVRKVNGAGKHSVKWQFIMENSILSFMSFLIAMLLVETFIGDFSALTASNVSFSYQTDGNVLLIFGLLTVLIGFLAGLYPAYYTASFSPLKLFSGNFKSIGNNKRPQTILVVIQFIITIALVSSVIGVQYQVNYLNNKPLGFNSENVIAVHGLTPKIRDNFSSIRGKLSNHASIKNITASMRIPGARGNGVSIRLVDDSPEESFSVDENLVRPGFLDTYSIKLLKGRGFREGFKTDQKGVLINETTAGKLGVKNPIDKEVMIGEFRARILGVFRDCHFRSLHHKIEPTILSQRLTRNYWISVKVVEGNIQPAIDHLQNVLESYDPSYQFGYTFIEDYFGRNYASDKKKANLIFSGTFLAIIISLMGLFALTAFNVEQRIKEIGIRKSLGASSNRIVKMFFLQYLKWLLVSSVLAFPLSYWFLERWFSEFAYSAGIKWWFFILACFISLFIAAVTVLMKSYRAARQNPVNTLRYE